MKGMKKISRGSSFGGTVRYAFYGDKKKPRELDGELIGGNMSGRTPAELTAEFNLSKAVRPDVAKPVWHNSLRLPEGDKVSKEVWNKIGERYMEKMGFSDSNQRMHELHDDPEGQHMHIVASRIGLDGKLFLGKNENLKSTRIIAELEVEFGLRITKGVDYDADGKIVMPDRSKNTKNELEKALRTGVEPPRVQLQKLVDQALSDKPTATQFVERLQLAGVDVIPNIASTGRLNGFSFGLDGVYFSGAKLGNNYKYNSLEKRGLSYDKNRESGFLEQLKKRVGDDAERGRAATNAVESRPGKNKGIHGGNEKDGENIRRDFGRGISRAQPGDSANNVNGTGHSDSATESAGKSGYTAAKNSERAEIGRISAETDPHAKTSAKRPAFNGGYSASEPDFTDGSGDNPAISTGVEIADAGLILTGDKGTDELLRAAHHARLKGARDSLKAGRERWEIGGDVAKKALADFNRPYTTKLHNTAAMGADVAAYRRSQIADFAAAMGVKTLDVVCTKPGEKTVKAPLNLDTLDTSSALKSISILSANGYQIGVQPAQNSGIILLKNVSSEDLKTLETAGFGAAVAVAFAGKKDAWINVGMVVNEGERAALTQRLGALVGVAPGAVGAGMLPGFAGATAAPLTTTIAPAAAELLLAVKAEIFEAKTAERLAKNAVELSGFESPLKDFLQSPGLNPNMRVGDIPEIAEPLFSSPAKPENKNKIRNRTKEPDGPSFG